MTDTFQKNGLVCERFILGPFQVNTYLVHDSKTRQLIIIDPALDAGILKDRIKAVKPESVRIFLTHGHADHILGVDAVKTMTGGKLYCSAGDAPMLSDSRLNLSQFLGTPITTAPPDEILKDRDSFSLGAYEGKVLAVPGHTPGSLVFCFDEMIFTGDTLFAGSIGRSDFPGGNHQELVSGIRRLILPLPDRLVFSGHGPETTISEEKAGNPFVADEA